MLHLRDERGRSENRLRPSTLAERAKRIDNSHRSIEATLPEIVRNLDKP